MRKVSIKVEKVVGFCCYAVVRDKLGHKLHSTVEFPYGMASVAVEAAEAECQRRDWKVGA